MTKKTRRSATASSPAPGTVFDGAMVPAERDAAEPRSAGDAGLLERCRSYWQMAEWERLCALAETDLASHRDRAKLAALAAAGFAQAGDMARARELASQAQGWGCSPWVVAQLLAGGAYNSLARAASLCEEEDRARRLFESSIACVMPQADPAVLGRARNIQEKMRLGQLPGAVQAIGEALQDEPVGARLDALGAQLAQVERRLAELTPPALALPEILKTTARSTARQPEHPLLVCCHHKTGTNFLLPLFRAISEEFALPLWFKFYDPEPEQWRICLHQHSRLEGMDLPANFRGLHMVRHPMGLIQSAALYHERAREPWLNIPMQRFTGTTFWALSSRDCYNIIKDPKTPVEEKTAILRAAPPPHARVHDFDSGYDFAGRTYAEMLKSFETPEERLLFEMRCYSHAVILDMLAFSGDRRFLALKLEEVSHDTGMRDLQTMVRHLGFSGPPAARVLEIAAENCLWKTGPSRHATTGVSDSWEPLFQGTLLEEFRHLFGWAEQALGYDEALQGSGP